MYQIYGFISQHSFKPVYVAEALGVDYEFHFVNLIKGDQSSESFLSKSPVGKVPVLGHDGSYLFESGAISRYLANAENSSLYPADPFARAKVDQWLDFFSLHLGRWLNTIYFESCVKPLVGMGEADAAKCEEAHQFAVQQFKLLDQHLQNQSWLANDAMSIADLCALAYVEQIRHIDFSLNDFPNVQTWFDKLDTLESTNRARAKVAPYLQHLKPA
jgi:glutathione S-transferase